MKEGKEGKEGLGKTRTTESRTRFSKSVPWSTASTVSGNWNAGSWARLQAYWRAPSGAEAQSPECLPALQGTVDARGTDREALGYLILVAGGEVREEPGQVSLEEPLSTDLLSFPNNYTPFS